MALNGRSVVVFLGLAALLVLYPNYSSAQDICGSNPCGRGLCTGFSANTQFYCQCTDGSFVVDDACPGPNWGTWGEWSACIATPGGEGRRTRTRSCVDDIPTDQLTDCVGNANEIENCDVDQCPTNGNGACAAQPCGNSNAECFGNELNYACFCPDGQFYVNRACPATNHICEGRPCGNNAVNCYGNLLNTGFICLCQVGQEVLPYLNSACPSDGMGGGGTDPVIQNCPADISEAIPRDPANTTPQFTNVQWQEPTATTASGAQPNVMRSRAPGPFPVGTTEVTYTFTDTADSSRSAVCSFNVIITDDVCTLNICGNSVACFSSNDNSVYVCQCRSGNFLSNQACP